MPCNSDYLEPSHRERELQRAAKLLVYVYRQLGLEAPKYAVATSKSIYASDDRSVIKLCDLLHVMTEDELNRIVYNAHDKQSRDLANWWETHQEADRKREEQERLEKERQKEKRRLQYEELKKEFD